MTESEYNIKSRVLKARIVNTNARFFPRCMRALLRKYAQLDAEYYGVDYENRKKELYEQYGVSAPNRRNGHG
ncbi:hypothetical protein [Prevotella histicola]|uniref:hypothetical protein n=1 Tax=Prevotella histicola TaxID=470565 RepID=UPI0012E09D04|nr:hypothetical protein [Prevotella histicola]